MKGTVQHIFFTVIAWALLSEDSAAQSGIQTIVTKSPVIVGESFQVQYVIEDQEKDNEFFAPDFKGFRFVSGPNVYTGTAYGPGGPRKLKNIVYTLAALNTGKLIIPGASMRVEDRLFKSGNVTLEVISKSQAFNKTIGQQEVNVDLFLGPGEDADEKIRRNLFMKVIVDKRSCFVGEPVTAIFKLYSRLNSKSDIVKNPGFYGFTVQDVINLEDKASGTETVNGKEFDVHTVRKVQLYPLQAGSFSIDPMEVRNKIRFNKSVVAKKAEQEIIEGIVPEVYEAADGNTALFENSMATEPVAITVKAVPLKNKPADFTGATGRFTITATLNKKQLHKDEEGDLLITISGRGNFTQLSPPEIKWPQGIEGFEPTIKDSLDHSHSPMKGKREFRFRFVSSKPGSYDLPAVGFSFFNPDTNSYKTIQTAITPVTITTTEKTGGKINAVNEAHDKAPSAWQWIIVLLACAAATGMILAYKKRKASASKQLLIHPVNTENSRPEVAQLLQPALVFSGAEDKTYYNILRNCIWSFFADRFGLKGSQVNKHSLSIILRQGKIDDQVTAGILEILSQCETGIFTSAEGAADPKKLLEHTKTYLENIDWQLRAV